MSDEDTAHPTYIVRYGAFQRVNHWVTAVTFILLALSGLAMFSPTFFWLTGLFGGGQPTRAVHPWIGLILFVSYALMFFAYWRQNIPNQDDVAWSKRIVDVINNREENLPELGKYNAGQKLIFWGQAGLIAVLLITGLVIWDWYFYAWTSIPVKRLAVTIHCLAAILAIALIIVHIYSAIWVKGTMRAMTRGTVTPGWAYRHHRKWFRETIEANGKGRQQPSRSGAD